MRKAPSGALRPPTLGRHNRCARLASTPPSAVLYRAPYGRSPSARSYSVQGRQHTQRSSAARRHCNAASCTAVRRRCSPRREAPRRQGVSGSKGALRRPAATTAAIALTARRQPSAALRPLAIRHKPSYPEAPLCRGVQPRAQCSSTAHRRTTAAGCTAARRWRSPSREPRRRGRRHIL